MFDRWLLAAAVVGVGAAGSSSISAQQQPLLQAQATQRTGKIQERLPSQPLPEIEELTPGQIQRAQEPEPPTSGGSPSQSRVAPKSMPGEPAGRAVACSGAFAKESSHVKLASLYNAQNVTFTDVDAPDGTKVKASVLFPKDSKRRLEVWWEDESARAGTYLIVINGQSTWAAPRGLKLGLQIDALEKLNGKPFKLRGFDKDGSSVTDWQRGALAQLPGGCKVGVRLVPDPKSTPQARGALPPTKEFASSDASVRALKPAVAEIILGY
jgi:hypothetical protein